MAQTKITISSNPIDVSIKFVVRDINPISESRAFVENKDIEKMNKFYQDGFVRKGSISKEEIAFSEKAESLPDQEVKMSFEEYMEKLGTAAAILYNSNNPKLRSFASNLTPEHIGKSFEEFEVKIEDKLNEINKEKENYKYAYEQGEKRHYEMVDRKNSEIEQLTNEKETLTSEKNELQTKYDELNVKYDKSLKIIELLNKEREYYKNEKKEVEVAVK